MIPHTPGEGQHCIVRIEWVDLPGGAVSRVEFEDSDDEPGRETKGKNDRC